MFYFVKGRGPDAKTPAEAGVFDSKDLIMRPFANTAYARFLFTKSQLTRFQNASR